MYKVLIVEDEALFRRTLKKIIESMEHYEVIGEMEDGAEIMDFCEKYHPDFICMDILLPGENGLSISQRVREKFPDICIFILSAYRDFHLVQMAMKIGLEAYLTKPYQPEEIKRTFYRYQTQFEKENDKKDLIAGSMGQKEILPAFAMCTGLVNDIFEKEKNEQKRYQMIEKIRDYCLD